jgi:hypothetical protein
VFTPPLVTGPPGPCICGECALTPETSYGFEFIEFNVELLGSPLDPWQQFLAVHAGELLPDGRPRFRHVLVLVSRQNGKTEVPVRLSLFWQFVEQVPLILGTSTKLDYARESWMKAVKLAERAPGIPVSRRDRKRWTRQTNGEQESTWVTADEVECRYKIAASNEEGGRSLTVNRLILDELRQHKSYAAWSAAEPAMTAVPDAQLWALSNAGDVTSVVLNDKRDAAVTFLETGEGDPRLGLFEWSAPEDADPLNIEHLAMANPNLGHRIDPESLLGAARTAVLKGGDALASFLVESMCVTVGNLRPAIDPASWAACLDVGTLDGVRSRVALCVDLAPDGQHATLMAAAVLDDGRVRVEVVAAWAGEGCTDALRQDLPGWVERVSPAVLGWFPRGPAAALAADLGESDGPGARTALEVALGAGRSPVSISAESASVCMGFHEQVRSGRVAHSADPLLDAHVLAATKRASGGRWVFALPVQGGHVDAAWSVAGAVHLARTMPAPVGRPRIVRARRSNT